MTESAREPGGVTDPAVHAAAAKAIELVSDGARVGLGSGRAVAVFIAKLGQLQQRGVRVTCVCASVASALEARRVGLSVVELPDLDLLDLAVDGADEVAPNLDLLKGRGGAMVRERIVAAAAKTHVTIVGKDKLVTSLGTRGGVPLEVIPMAEALVMRRVKGLRLTPRLRVDKSGSRPFMSDNGNVIVDCAFSAPIHEAVAARQLEQELLDIPGVVDTGFFLGVTDRVIVGSADGKVEERFAKTRK